MSTVKEIHTYVRVMRRYKLRCPGALRIPRLGVDAAAVPVGVETDRRLAVPQDVREVGWYRFGAAPGSTAGSTVLVGHVDPLAQGIGVLEALDSVRQGDTTEVLRVDGPPTLAMITCAGPYDPDRGGYQRALVVVATPMR
jgi:hypothetical protein